MPMHPVEIEASLNTMVCLVDTREQDTPSFRKRVSVFDNWERHKLDSGDYSAKFLMPDGEWFYLPVAIERKYSIDELCMCFCRQRGRFEREFQRACASNTKMYLLIENGSLNDICAGKYRSKMNPKSLMASFFAWMVRYNFKPVFCQSRSSGLVIKEILYREGKEALSKKEVVSK